MDEEKGDKRVGVESDNEDGGGGGKSVDEISDEEGEAASKGGNGSEIDEVEVEDTVTVTVVGRRRVLKTALASERQASREASSAAAA